MACVANVLRSRLAGSSRRIKRYIMTETNPTPAEVIEVALSGSGGAVKSLTDIRLEKMEKQLAELAQMNIELRKANAELYAFVASNSKAEEPAPKAPESQPAAAPVMQKEVPIAAEVQAPAQPDTKKDEDAILREALSRLGYKKQETDNSGL